LGYGEGTVIYASVRRSSNKEDLEKLAQVHSNVHIVNIDHASIDSDLEQAVKDIEKVYGHLDVVIANAGVTSAHIPVAEIPIETARNILETNVLDVVTLFQKTYPLMKKAKQPKFVGISSIVGSLTLMTSLKSVAAYNASKAAMNAFFRIISIEHLEEGLIAIPLHPGWVQTDMGNLTARDSGLKEAPTSIEESVAGQIKVINEATSDISGKFMTFDGNELPW
jgi:norsolorinic acid ketoreductase